MFLNIYESERGNVNEDKKNENLGISISCGSFSYAEMVDSFSKIFGVTGTLESLNEFENLILKRYKINLKTFAPSVYGESRIEKKAILIEQDKGKHYQMIASTIINSIKKKGSIIVFFEDENKLRDFEKTSYCDHFKDKMNIVTEKSFDRDFYIKKST